MEDCGISTNEFISRNLVPVTLGNILGAVIYTGIQYLIYHPYIQEDTDHMSLRQGGDYLPFSRSLSKNIDHQVPAHKDTCFKYLWSGFSSNNDVRSGNSDSSRISLDNAHDAAAMKKLEENSNNEINADCNTDNVYEMVNV